MRRSTRPPLNNQFSVLMVGYYGSGKTSILNRFARNIFEPEYHMSLTSSSFTRLFSIDSNLSVKLKLIDSLGSGLTKQMVNNGVSPSDALLLVYDLTNQESFYRLDRWMSEMRHIISQSTLIILVGTHSDQPYKRRVSEREANEWKHNNNVSIFFQISNKTNENIMEMFQQICLKLAFVHRNNSLPFVANPEQSLIYHESATYPHGNSRVIILEKKLKFKEEECNQLWRDYEDALRKIEDLELYRGIKPDKNDLLNSMIIESQTDTDQMGGKIRSLEENIKVLEQYYTNKQSSFEESTFKKIQNLNLKITQLQSQIQTLKKTNAQQKLTISELQNQKQTIQSSLSELKLDFDQKVSQYATLLQQLDHLKTFLDQNASSIQKEIQIPLSSSFTFNIVRLVHQKFASLIKCLQNKQSQLLKYQQDMRVTLQKHQHQKDQYQNKIQSLSELKQGIEQQIQQYEEKMCYYRAESILRQKLEKDIVQLNICIAKMEDEFHHKCQWYIETIEQREKTIKVLIENAKYQQDKIKYLKEEYDKIYAQIQEKDRIIEKKQALMSRVVGQKVNQINQLKGFIEQIGKKSSHIVKKLSKQIKNPSDDVVYLQKENQTYINFFEQFLQKTKHRSQAMLEYLTGVATNLGQVCETFTDIQVQTQELQITEYLFDCSQHMFLSEKNEKLAKFRQYIEGEEIDRADLALFADEIEKLMSQIHDWQYKFWQKMRNESSCRVSKVLSLLCFAQGQLEENTNSFKSHLQEISNNIESIDGITGYGVQEYIHDYFK